jgi:hypothetical protein
MSFRSLLLLTMIFAATISVVAQGTVDQHGVYHPTEEEIARNKRMYELLQHPTFITLRLATTGREVPREVSTDTPTPYKLKDYIGLQLFITQNSSETITLGNLMWPYYEYRPELMRDGETVPYSPAATANVQRAESGPRDGSVISIKLLPAQENRWAFIKLEDWYGPLGAGRYQLIVRKQFAWNGDWVASNPVYFEVQPRPPASPIPKGVTIELARDDNPNAKLDNTLRFEGDVGFAWQS